MLVTRRDLFSALGTVATAIFPIGAPTTAGSSGPLSRPESLMVVPDKKAESSSAVHEGYLGSLVPVIRSIQQEHGFPLAYELRGGISPAEWRNRGRAAVANDLGYSPAPVPLDVRIERRISRVGYELRVISFAGTSHYRIPAFLLIPEGKGPFRQWWHSMIMDPSTTSEKRS